MRIYDGSPRQDWEEVLRSIGAFADQEKLKELLFLELEAGFLLQGLGMPGRRRRFGQLRHDRQAHLRARRRPGRRADGRHARRAAAPPSEIVPHTDLLNYYEQALRIIGAYIDNQKAHDVFCFEQDGSFVLRLFGVAGSPRRRSPALRIHQGRDRGYDRVRTRVPRQEGVRQAGRANDRGLP